MVSHRGVCSARGYHTSRAQGRGCFIPSTPAGFRGGRRRPGGRGGRAGSGGTGTMKESGGGGGVWRVFRAGGRVRGRKLPRTGGGRMLQMCNKFALGFWPARADWNGRGAQRRDRWRLGDRSTWRLGPSRRVGKSASREADIRGLSPASRHAQTARTTFAPRAAPTRGDLRISRRGRAASPFRTCASPRRRCA